MAIGIDSATERSVKETSRRRVRRPSMGHLAVLVAALLAFVANVALIRSMDESVEVAVAAAPIEAGQVVGSGDLTTALVRAEPHVLASLWMAVDSGFGLVASRDLEPGELVGDSDLIAAASPSGSRVMAIPVDPAHAAGGAIRIGDRVDVVDINEQGVATYVVRNARVVRVSSEGSGALASGTRHLSLEVADDQVLALAEAIADGRVDVVLSTGADHG